MISLTAGGGTRPSRKMLPPGLSKPNSETPAIPDNDYLETMKQRMKGLPVNTSGATAIKKALVPNQIAFDGNMT